jgi:hypothetical protein
MLLQRTRGDEVSAAFRRTLFVIASLLALGVVACIIGPKHDDPGAPRPLDDTGLSFDTDKTEDVLSGGDAAPDTAVPLGADSEADVPPDGCADGGGDADAPSEGGCGDTSSDAPTEGG